MALDTKYKRPEPTIHHKKSVGAHQKHDQRFLKTYWPYLPLLFVAAFVIIFASSVFGPAGALIGGVSCLIAGLALVL